MHSKIGNVVFTITAHGLGHLTRSVLIIESFCELLPQIDITVSTSIAKTTVDRFLTKPFQYRNQSYEPGTVQKNCFEVDMETTRTEYQRYIYHRDHLLEEETDFLQKIACSGLVSDIPSISLKAAAKLRIPSIGISNFTWDWILEPILRNSPGEHVLDQLTQDYSCGCLHLRLPFGPDSSPFPAMEKVPLVARQAKLSPAAVKKILNVPQSETRQLIVVCPGGWEPKDWGTILVKDCSSFRFLFVGDLPISCEAPHIHLPHKLPKEVTFPDLINTADLVVAKPGYGIAAECLLHQTPIVFIERPNFRETPLLIDAFSNWGSCASINLDDFFSGYWKLAIDCALEKRTFWANITANGASIVAKRLANYFYSS